MYVAVIGPLEVRTDDLALVPVPGAQERLLLATLAASAPDPVGGDDLARTLWGGHPPADPERSLRALVVGLRGALEPGLPTNASGRYVLRRRSGYVLALPRGEIDAHRFTVLAERGRAWLDSGDLFEAERVLANTLRLWRGEPYADWPGAEFAAEQRRRLSVVREEAEASLREARSRLAGTGERPRPAALPFVAPVPVVAPAAAPAPRRAPVPVPARPVPVPARTPLAVQPPTLAGQPPGAAVRSRSVVPPAHVGPPVSAPAPGRTSADRRRRLLVGALVVSTVLAAALAIRSQESVARRTEVAETRDVRDEAERLADLSVTDGPFDVSLLLAVQAYRLADIAETRNALRAVLISHPRADRVVPIPGTPQGVTLAGAGPTLTYATGYDIVAWPVGAGTQPAVLMPIPNEWGVWSAVTPSPTDDAIVGVGEHEGVPWVRMVDVVDGSSRLLLVGDQPGGAPLDGAVAPDGRRVVLLVAEADPTEPSASRWRVIEVDAADGSRHDTGVSGTFPGTRATLAVDFSQDAGSFVVWDRVDEDAMLVDLADGHQARIAAATDQVGTVGFRAFPGGAARLGADGTITLIDRDGRTRQVLEHHRGAVLDVAVSPDGTWAASAGEGVDRGEVYRWAVDPTTGGWSSPEPLTGHYGPVVDVESDATGARLVTVALDQTAISWDMAVDAGRAGAALSAESSDLLAAACAIVARDFTPPEWNRYLPDRPFTPTCTDLL